MKTLTTYIMEKAKFLVKKHINKELQKQAEYIEKRSEKMKERMASKEYKKAGKWELSMADLDELEMLILQDNDFKDVYKSSKNFENFEEAVDYFVHDFLEQSVYVDGGKDVHRFYMLDGPDLGCSYVKLASGKYVNLDNVWGEFKEYLA